MLWTNLVGTDESFLAQLALAVELVPLGQAVAVLGLERGDTLLHGGQLLSGIVQDALRHRQVLMGLLQGLLRGEERRGEWDY